MFNGYLSFGGTEIANASRVEAYVRNLLSGFPLRGCQGCESLQEALGDEPYYSPLQDAAPWVDPANTATYDFLGFYPVKIEGVESATTSTEVVQSIGFGGYNNIPRDATREIRVQGVLIATTDLGLEAGMTWLREALRPSLCGDHGGSCVGSDMCYYAACPELTICYTEEGVDNGPSQLDNLTVGSGPVMVMNTFEADERIEGLLTPSPASDGLTYNWGVSTLVGDVSNINAMPIDAYGPVTPQRTNVVQNPHFTVGTTLWTTSSAALTRVAASAPDGGASGHLIPTGTGLLRTSVEDAQFGQNMLQFQLRTPGGATTFDVNIRSALDNSLVQTQTFAASAAWTPYTLVVPFARGNILEFSSADTFDITTVLMEGGTAQMPYFDGDTLPAMPASHAPDAPTPEYAVSWVATPHASASRMLWLGDVSFAFCGEGQYAWVQVLSGFGSLSASWESFARISTAEQSAKYERTMHDVVIMSGPITTQEMSPRIGAGRLVEFILSAANPYAYATPRDLLLRYPLDSLPVQTWVDIAAPAEPMTIIIDPDCPPLPTPPQAPAIVNSCIDGPGVWDRYSYVIPADEVSEWSRTLPTVILNSGLVDVRQIRARLTPNPFDYPVVTTNKINLTPYPSAELATGTVTVLTNLCPNPSGESATTGWTAIPGTTGVAAVTNPAPSTTTAFGTKVLKCTWSTASTAAGGGMYIDAAVVAGSIYSFSVGHIKASITNRLKLRVEWRTAIGTISNSDDAEFVATGGTIYSKTLAGLTAPATATVARITVLSVAGTSYANWSISSYLEMDGVIATNSTLVQTYFDGATVAAGDYTYAWSGTAQLSTSTQLAPAATGMLLPTTGGGGIAANYRTAVHAHSGTYSSRSLFTVSQSSDVAMIFGTDSVVANNGAVVVGGTYYGSVWVYISKTQRVHPRIQWRDIAGVALTPTDGAEVVVVANTWTRLSVSGVAPATAVAASIRVRNAVSGASYTRWAAADYIELDDFMLTEGVTLYDYFDGSSPDAAGWFYGWEGTANASVSVGQQSVIDPYSYCGEFILSYLPADAELVVDGALTRSWASVGGAPSIPASNLLYGTDGTPVVWPEMTCGIPYLLTVDVPVGTGDELLLSLALTRRE